MYVVSIQIKPYYEEKKHDMACVKLNYSSVTNDILKWYKGHTTYLHFNRKWIT